MNVSQDEALPSRSSASSARMLAMYSVPLVRPVTSPDVVAAPVTLTVRVPNVEPGAGSDSRTMIR